MSALIKYLHIKNFKSVRDLSLDCERINVFIGKPNAGKSNILEAISLLGADHALRDTRFMTSYLRYKSIEQLFTRFDINQPISVIADEVEAELRASFIEQGAFKFSISVPATLRQPDNGFPIFSPLTISMGKDGSKWQATFDKESSSPIKKYDFRSFNTYEERGLFLHPPYGENLFYIANTNPEIREEIQRFLKPNGFEFLRDIENKSMAIVQKTEDSLLSYPMYLVPDTFQRYVFHLAAILSNKESVLLFEEPEAHSYAPYVYQLTRFVLDDSNDNQFFITTHNPYFLLPLLQESSGVAVFTTWFENYQTHVRRMSEEEIRDILDYGVDIFLNLDQFIPA